MKEPFSKILNSLKTNKSLKVGWFEEGIARVAYRAEYGLETPKEEFTQSTINYYLTNKKNIPEYIGNKPRPHREVFISENKNKISELIGNLLVKNNFDTEKTLKDAGEEIENMYRNIFYTHDFAPLSHQTLDMRKFKGISGDRPLVATGKLQDELKHKVDGDD